MIGSDDHKLFHTKYDKYRMEPVVSDASIGKQVYFKISNIVMGFGLFGEFIK